MKKYLILFLTLSFFLGSCGKRKAKKLAEENDAEIVAYLEANNISATKTETGLYYVIDSLTSGSKPTEFSYVSIVYKGYYTDNTIFDQSPGSGSTFYLQSVIAGWSEGVPYFPERSKGRLFIPSHLGYGRSDYGDIPGGSVLIFDIEVLEVQ